MEVTVQTTDHKDSPQTEIISVLDVVAGATGRRRWTKEAKSRIVAESYALGVSVLAVARRHKLRPAQLHLWRRAARDGKLVLPAGFGDVFVPAVVEAPAPPEPGPDRDVIEIEFADLLLRLGATVSTQRVVELVSALRTAR